jgi:hypothetical protein
MTTMTQNITQVYQLFIKATPEQIWEAITTPEFTQRYFHGARITVTPESYREGAPKTAQSVSGAGWMMVLSGLKTLLETGKPLAG